jgi:hypothetical protein
MDDGGHRAILREAWPEVAGRPGLTQGRYGAAGNLELVVPAVDDGLWVGWFNRDPVESHAGAAVQRWSGALGASAYECETDRTLARCAERLTILADASKFTRRSPHRIAPTERIAELVTSADADPDDVEALRARGVEVRVVG